MKQWVVRFASLYVFNVLVLLAIGFLLPRVQVGFAALWGAVILTAGTIWLKPLISRLFAPTADKIARKQNRLGEKLVQYGAVFVVELIVWILVVVLSGIRVQGLVFAWILPPLLLLVAWIIYDQVDDAIHARTSALYDRAETGLNRRESAGSGAGAEPPSPQTSAARAELKDGLTPEQRRMFDDLDKS